MPNTSNHDEAHPVGLHVCTKCYTQEVTGCLGGLPTQCALSCSGAGARCAPGAPRPGPAAARVSRCPSLLLPVHTIFCRRTVADAETCTTRPYLYRARHHRCCCCGLSRHRCCRPSSRRCCCHLACCGHSDRHVSGGPAACLAAAAAAAFPALLLKHSPPAPLRTSVSAMR